MNKKHDTPTLQSFTVVGMVILAIITLGFSLPFWALSRYNLFNRLSAHHRVHGGWMIGFLLCLIISTIGTWIAKPVSLLDPGYLSWLMWVVGASIGVNISAIVVAFQMRAILRDRYDHPVSILGVLLFHLFAIQHAINHIVIANERNKKTPIMP